MARTNRRRRTFSLSVSDTTKSLDNVQMKALDYYCKMDPPYTSPASKLKLVRLEKGIGSLIELEKSTICNYLNGFFRTFRKNYNKIQPEDMVDIYQTYVLPKNYAPKASFYKYRTWKTKSSNTINALNRIIAKRATAYQEGANEALMDIPDHWRFPPTIEFGEDVESLAAKRVCFIYTFYTFYILYVFITSANHSVL